MKININGITRDMTKKEIAEFQKECEVKSTETIEDLKSQAVEMQSELAELIDKINRLESEVDTNE